MNKGELVESGCHDDLMKKEKGFYKKLYEIQFTKEVNNQVLVQARFKRTNIIV